MGFFSDSPFLFSVTPAGHSQSVWRPLRQHLTQVRDLQAFCAQSRLHGAAFIAELLRQLQITVSYNPAELRRLPSTGAFIAVANHPNGLLDELALLHVLGQHRPDLRVVASRPLAALFPQITAQLVLAPAARRTGGQMAPTLRQVLCYLHNDVPVALLRAGEEPRAELFRPTPAPDEPVLVSKLLTAARVPVVPVWFSNHHSPSFNWLGLVSPWLRTVPLPAALLNRRGQTIQVRIGQLFSPQELSYLPPNQRWPCVRARVEGLRELPEVTAGSWPHLLPQAVAAVPATTRMEADLAALSFSRRLIVHGFWEVYVARPAEIPSILAEIKRLRALACQRLGEGSSQATNSAGYDEQQHHLLLYHREARCLVGACRLGKGRVILRQHGKQGFYLHSLFRLKKELRPLLRESLELGCSFIRAEYQHQALPAALLWKGLAEYVATHPEYRYVLAPVAIGAGSGLAKAMVAKEISRYFLDAERAQWVRPRKAYRYRPLAAGDAPASTPTRLATAQQNAQKLVAELAPAGLTVPALLRSHLQQNARFLGFNLDPGFTNALHGFLLLDVRELPLSALCLLSRPT